MNSITFFSMKGGTGKTTLSSSIAWILAEEGHSTLMIDLDPQGHLTHFYKIKPQPGRPNLFGSLIFDQPLAEAIIPTSHPNLFILPSTDELLDLNEALISRPWREWKLKDALHALDPFPYDFVIIDVGASLSLISFNALFAARTLMIPVLPDLFSYFSLKTFFAYLGKTCNHYHFHFEMIWILINKINNYRPLDRENKEALQKYYQHFLVPFTVREDPKLTEALRLRTPITRYAPESSAARDLKKVAHFIKRVDLKPQATEVQG
jgi:chromosome partitioning protein